jgi:hypothetical protein
MMLQAKGWLSIISKMLENSILNAVPAPTLLAQHPMHNS